MSFRGREQSLHVRSTPPSATANHKVKLMREDTVSRFQADGIVAGTFRAPLSIDCSHAPFASSSTNAAIFPQYTGDVAKVARSAVAISMPESTDSVSAMTTGRWMVATSASRWRRTSSDALRAFHMARSAEIASPPPPSMLAMCVNSTTACVGDDLE